MKIKMGSFGCAALRLGCAVLALWLICMAVLTSVTAEYAAARYEESHRNRANTIMGFRIAEFYERETGKANYRENLLWESMRRYNFSDMVGVSSDAEWFIERPDGEEIFTASVICDAEGNIIYTSEEDFFFFEYLTEDQWDAREERSGNNARAVFDREKLTPEGIEAFSDGSTTFDASLMRFQGTFDGVELIPSRIDIITCDDFDEALRKKGSGSYTRSGVAQDYRLEWVNIYEDKSLHSDVTLYSDWFGVAYREESPSFTFEGEKYESTHSLLKKLAPEYADGLKYRVSYEGAWLILPSVSYCTVFEGDRDFSPYFYGSEAYVGEGPKAEFYIVSLVVCSPWLTALAELKWVYLLTFLAFAACTAAVLASLNAKLIRPVALTAEAMAEEKDGIYAGKLPDVWKEPRELLEGFSKYTDIMRVRKNEITRLETALRYARNAEQRRRQLTSAITHDLKTPLAVIRSHAEALREHVAEEKRDDYLDIILSETDRTDAMVLEMLDLSRLEAGRVRLARDDFSLSDLVREVFARLKLQAEEKSLQMSFDLPEVCTVNADRSRLSQVIENFASNAVSYTPPGGRVKVRLKEYKRAVRFTVENDSPPLSEAALERVWDSFYRAEGSRSGRGTGLGLAIAKRIVELHGGDCFVSNTPRGVEFGFTLYENI